MGVSCARKGGGGGGTLMWKIQMTCVGEYDIKLLVYKKCMEENKCICISNTIKNELM